jgi:hypothetical protein
MCRVVFLMAVGDVVTQIYTGTQYNHYQPAVGVEVVITSVQDGGQTSTPYGTYDGTTYAKFPEGTVTGERVNPANTKIMINNTNYFRIYSNTTAGFTGLQIGA